MSRVLVLGAGVIGRSYAALLARSGHEICLVTREESTDPGRHELVVELDGERLVAPCTSAPDLASAPPVDLLLIAVRGEQLETVLEDIAATSIPLIVCFTNPLGTRDELIRQVGEERLVLAFSGLGGAIEDSVVQVRSVAQQPTVVDVAAPLGPVVAELLAGTGIPLRRERRMADWLDTHSVFMAGMSAAVLSAPDGAARVAGDRPRAIDLVVAMSEGMTALERHGRRIRPSALRWIFGRVPRPIAARYWQRQFAGPTVTASIAPHAETARRTEMPAVFAYARELVGEEALRYRRLLDGAVLD